MARVGLPVLRSLHDDRRPGATDDGDGVDLVKARNRLAAIAQLELRARGQAVSPIHVAKAAHDSPDLKAAASRRSYRLALTNDPVSKRELIRQRRLPRRGARVPLAPLPAFGARKRRQRQDKAAERRCPHGEGQHTATAAGEHADDPRHDQAAAGTRRVIEKQRAALVHAHCRSAGRAEPHEGCAGKRPGIGSAGRRPAEFHEQEQLFAVDLRRNVGQQSRDAGNRAKHPAQHRERQPQRLQEAGPRPRRHHASRDQSDRQSARETEQRHPDDEIAGGAFKRRDVIPVRREARDDAAQPQTGEAGEDGNSD